jgi:hypothetical protein
MTPVFGSAKRGNNPRGLWFWKRCRRVGRESRLMTKLWIQNLVFRIVEGHVVTIALRTLSQTRHLLQRLGISNSYLPLSSSYLQLDIDRGTPYLKPAAFGHLPPPAVRFQPGSELLEDSWTGCVALPPPMPASPRRSAGSMASTEPVAPFKSAPGSRSRAPYRYSG